MQHNKFNNRSEKISFLKGITTGRTSLNELLPQDNHVWFLDEGQYSRLSDGQLLTRTEFEAFKAQRPNSTQFVIVEE